MTLLKLKRYFKTKYSSNDDIEDNHISLLLDIEDENLIKSLINTHIKEVTDKDYKVLTNQNYGFYNYCSSKEDLTFNLILEVLDNYIRDTNYSFKNIIKSRSN